MRALADTQLEAVLAGSPYVAYCYAYPHKTAYRPLVPALPLDEAWRDEDTGALFLYLHVPFCEVRCGFCNLFTLARPEASLPAQYLAALRRQADVTKAAFPAARIAQLAIGGGTPTFLNRRTGVTLSHRCRGDGGSAARDPSELRSLARHD